jgi:2-polyprenyl-6-methoxyphenol hydroxylase-like FAD-dependent oxidoreductase
MKALRVAVIGCGTAGPAAALLLARAGHEVEVFERTKAPTAAGAGIMLQPTGQAVLARLGLLDDVLARGERIDSLVVEKANRAPLLSLKYHDVSRDYFGIGLHRGVLFTSLFNALKDSNCKLHLGVECTALEPAGRGTHYVESSSGERFGPYDLVIVADGARSGLRTKTQLSTKADTYPWGAVWWIAPDPDHVFREQLYQLVDSTHTLLGMLPTGRGPEGAADSHCPHVSIFWSIRGETWNGFRARPVEEFKARVTALCPQAAPLLDALTDSSQLLYSSYADVVMPRWSSRGLVHIGDSAHAMSPQLGQGCNLALIDAWVLAECIQSGSHVDSALDAYNRQRKQHLAYYQFVTRWLTPFFQSDYAVLGALRDIFMPMMNRFDVFNRAMVMGMCGTADGHPWKPLALPSSRQ